MGVEVAYSSVPDSGFICLFIYLSPPPKLIGHCIKFQCQNPLPENWESLSWIARNNLFDNETDGEKAIITANNELLLLSLHLCPKWHTVHCALKLVYAFCDPKLQSEKSNLSAK